MEMIFKSDKNVCLFSLSFFFHTLLQVQGLCVMCAVPYVLHYWFLYVTSSIEFLLLFYVPFWYGFLNTLLSFTFLNIEWKSMSMLSFIIEIERREREANKFWFIKRRQFWMIYYIVETHTTLHPLQLEYTFSQCQRFQEYHINFLSGLPLMWTQTKIWFVD